MKWFEHTRQDEFQEATLTCNPFLLFTLFGRYQTLFLITSNYKKYFLSTIKAIKYINKNINMKVRKYYELNNYTKLFIPNKNFLRISRKFKTCISTVSSLYHEMYPKRFLAPPQEKATSEYVHKNYSIYIKSCMMGDYMQKEAQPMFLEIILHTVLDKTFSRGKGEICNYKTSKVIIK